MTTTTLDTATIRINTPAGSSQNYPSASISVRTINNRVEREFTDDTTGVEVTDKAADVTDGFVQVAGIPINLGITTLEVYSKNGTGDAENYNKILTDAVLRITGTDNLVEQVLF